ncbi:16S rRNA (cytidine(1402)-2'-O)-methyltransferase [Pseudoramibacter sp.]|jgi:16S rRNA (cytidine1402-2'-O)-methyltransferase|uniref:16S rRNA (cytidine(1402)-2'-O)-methyltransferase n=1 Tax=Pseudoramibacter sp. TaxID=2034862 RepID=UPI0025E1D8F9|nr:16S rRNA (cytidine(1402)-2'-O)-methyltransferase [Pseudoramibacter sp.]MCH4071939.1 16S rRNA (cytidine(1402)-2'-O)-methyltransferase [Pseudoramibacter sp.]MCH4105707.1 16S rRNA (cytidine(1402)-2'-O)-methyltransferase [Pseudoramibacter sp.]
MPLSIVGTPIGNLEDFSPRAVRVLQEADLIAAEDTRNTLKLLNHFEIHTPMTAYHKFNEKTVTGELVQKMQAGAHIALVSDAGMPVLSDPGRILVRACQDAGVPVTAVPGPTASVTAVALSGIDCRHFVFFGFLGKSSKEIREGLEAVEKSPWPVVLYESPHRLLKTLEQMAGRFPDREMSISREITKRYEETRRDTVAGQLAYFTAHPPKGEFVLVVDKGDKLDSKAAQIKALSAGSAADHVAYYLRQGLSEKDAMKAAAKDRGVSKREIYKIVKIDG